MKSFEVEFQAVKEGLGGQLLRFETEDVESAGWKGKTRVIMHLPDGEKVHRALRPSKLGHYFIAINKKECKKQGWEDGMSFQIRLEEDRTTYQMDAPEEFHEVLRQDPEGKALFEAQPPGKQRSMLHYISSTKNPQLRIERTMLFLDRMKENGDPSRP